MRENRRPVRFCCISVTLRRPRLELAGREEDDLTVLALGEDTTVFETTAKTGGHDHPALPVETVEVLAKEHCCVSPSVLMSLTPFSRAVSATMTHFIPLVNLFPHPVLIATTHGNLWWTRTKRNWVVRD